MKIIRIIVLIAGGLILVLLVFFAIYRLIHRQGIIETQEITSPSVKFNVLIASQGSQFKDNLVDSIVNILKERSVNAKIIDVTGLTLINESDWDALIFIHTTEKWQLQPDVKAFLDRAKDLNKIMLVTTSGDGKWKNSRL